MSPEVSIPQLFIMLEGGGGQTTKHTHTHTHKHTHIHTHTHATQTLKLPIDQLSHKLNNNIPVDQLY